MPTDMLAASLTMLGPCGLEWLMKLSIVILRLSPA